MHRASSITVLLPCPLPLTHALTTHLSSGHSTSNWGHTPKDERTADNPAPAPAAMGTPSAIASPDVRGSTPAYVCGGEGGYGGVKCATDVLKADRQNHAGALLTLLF